MMDLRDSTSMRNYELIKEIYEICQTADYRDEGHVVPEIITDLIEKERPELVKVKED